MFKRVSLSENQLRVVINALDAYFYDIVDDYMHPAQDDLETVRIILNRLKRTADPEAERVGELK